MSALNESLLSMFLILGVIMYGFDLLATILGFIVVEERDGDE